MVDLYLSDPVNGTRPAHGLNGTQYEDAMFQERLTLITTCTRHIHMNFTRITVCRAHALRLAPFSPFFVGKEKNKNKENT